MASVSQMQNRDISTILIIDPKYMNDRKYIEKKIYEKQGKCDKDGYIEKIYKINSIKFHKFYEQNFSGSILIKVVFNADIINLNTDDVIECELIQANEDGIVAQGTYPIFIIIDEDFEALSFLKIKDTIFVKITKTVISIDRNIIRAIGKFISLSIKDSVIEESIINKDGE